MADHDTLISNFCELTSASAQQATEYLTASHWDIDSAVASYFTDLEEGDQAPASGASAAAPEPAYTGPRTLDGRPAPQYAAQSASSSSKKPQKRTGLATLSSLGGGQTHDDSEDDDDYDDDDDERRGPRDLFAGGEKSGLAVQDPAQRSSDPRKVINDLMAKARANAREAEEEAAGPSRPRFRGTGQTLGGDGVESRVIPDPRGSAIPTAASEGPVQERVLHIWTDGFSIDDGELRRFDDPQNRADLQMIREGRAPIHLMNVRMDQRVNVKLEQHKEDYRPLPKVYRPFGGEGRRLGSPVPGELDATPPPAAATTTAPAASQVPTTGVDESQPTLMLRIQLPDGARLPARFNTNQTVGDVYDFVQRSSPSINSGRTWVLSTTFPNKEHEDKGLVLGEMPEFKRGGTAVVKWK
ncbi:UBX domain-containing protein 1 [Staphylotrichum tortipilum]|uniref:UBX domain-containing protein 1 n=1 Tax=Staphylotrichum tortipilum TaxID=2831512 RepID=A0AAN6MPK6_9PEZI|nr:UBX domain-containing protein 1 [Staphylotrichum longicolle]